MHLVQPIDSETLTPIPSNIVELPKHFFYFQMLKVILSLHKY